MCAGVRLHADAGWKSQGLRNHINGPRTTGFCGRDLLLRGARTQRIGVSMVRTRGVSAVGVRGSCFACRCVGTRTSRHFVCSGIRTHTIRIAELLHVQCLYFQIVLVVDLRILRFLLFTFSELVCLWLRVCLVFKVNSRVF